MKRPKILPYVAKEGLLAQPLNKIQKEGEERPTRKTWMKFDMAN